MRLIDADALLKALHNFFDGKVIDEPAYILRDVYCYIDGAPTVVWCSETSEGYPLMDLRPREEGEWVVVEDHGDLKFMKCSNCGEIEGSWCGKSEFISKSKFCSNCGAKMKGGAE